MFRFRFGGLILALGILLVSLVGSAHITLAQDAQNTQGDGIGTPQYKTIPYIYPVRPNATTIPFWSNSFTYDGQTYPYTMIGTDPSKGPASSTVPTEIIPLKFVFANGVALDGSSKTNLTVASPIFQNAVFDSGTTQYGDAIQRASFWTTGGSDTGYHVLLGQPKILPAETINVPLGQGQEFTGSRSGAPIGLISYYWFSGQLGNLLGKRHIDPRTMPIFLTYNTFLYINTLGNCCVLGFHGALSASANGQGVQPIQTLIYAAYSDPGIFGAPDIQDIHALSHEVSEAMADPFANNTVPSWSVPSEPQYGCSSVLEVGDPLVGVGFTVGQYHPEDEAFFSWFAREDPSRAIDGRYTYLGTFGTFSPSC